MNAFKNAKILYRLKFRTSYDVIYVLKILFDILKILKIMIYVKYVSKINLRI